MRATDNVSIAETPSSRSFTYDTSAPSVTLDSGPSDPSNEVDPSFAFSTSETASFECRLDDDAFGACSSPQDYSGLAEGAHTFRVRATDAAGNTGAATVYDWTIDTSAPSVTLESGPSDPSNEVDPGFAFSTSETASFECRLDDDAFGACSSPQDYSGLAEGAHTFRVRATDAAGNTGAATVYDWTIDTSAPSVTLDSGPSDPSNEVDPSFAFSTSETASFECRLDDDAFGACSSPQDYSGLAEGAHTFRVRATDAAGNTGAATVYDWTIDTSASALNDLLRPLRPLQRGRSELCLLHLGDGQLRVPPGRRCLRACSSPQDYSGLAEGAHTFRVRATDAAGNTGAATVYDWTIDTSAPSVTLDSGPSDPSNEVDPSFAFSTSETASFECRLDDDAFGACSSPQDYSGLAEGAHTFRVRATDAAGNTGAATVYDWTIDTSAPSVTLDSGPSDPSNEVDPSFAFSTSETASFECRLDDDAFGACSSPQDYSGLAEGAHTFRVRATDAAGNTGAATVYDWTIDTSAPSVTLDSGPSDPSNEVDPSFAFSTSETASFECRLDDDAFGACSSPQDYSGLAEGAHTFRVRATDAAGNTGAATVYDWTIDTSAPSVTLDSGPSDPSNEVDPSFAFSTSETASFECRLDDDAFGACSSPQDYSGPAQGAISSACGPPMPPATPARPRSTTGRSTRALRA